MKEKIKEALREVMEDNSLKLDDTTNIITEVGLDSIQTIEFLLVLEEKLGKEFDYENLQYEMFESIEKLAEELKKNEKKE